MDVKIEIDIKKISDRIKDAERKALFVTSVQALKDCNVYCPEDQRTLLKSSEISSDLDNGKLVWDTPYAKKVYYTGNNFTKKRARKMWAHYAKNRHGKEWEEVYQNALNKNL
jgi:hypothetical protein